MNHIKTPLELNFRMPAEWEKHEATWLSWPKDPLTFPEEIIDRVEQIYVEIIESLRVGERVELLVDDEKTEDEVSSLLGSKNNIRFHKIKSADVWMRDYGPIFIKNHEVAATKWLFNAWGNKYDELLKDDHTGIEICKITKFKTFEPKIVLEGGSIDTNGARVCLTTKQCLLNTNRNPSLNEKEIEKCLSNYLGFTNFIWLSEGIAGDDTDGHVDDIARFVNESTVVCVIERDNDDENFKPLARNYEKLAQSKDAEGHQLDVVAIDMPHKVKTVDGRLPASYANFYIGNSAVLVPIFGDPKRDEEALSKIRGFFPGRKTIGINCRELVYGFGGIHCITQQQPA